MNIVFETEVKEVVAVERTANEAQGAVVVEMDALDLSLVGGGLVSPCFA